MKQLSDEERRIAVQVRIHPSTLETIKTMKESNYGRAIDKMARLLREATHPGLQEDSKPEDSAPSNGGNRYMNTRQLPST